MVIYLPLQTEFEQNNLMKNMQMCHEMFEKAISKYIFSYSTTTTTITNKVM